MAIYADQSYRFTGHHVAYGGRSHTETGGAGTVFVQRPDPADNRTHISHLYIDNGGYQPMKPFMENGVSGDSGRSYVVNSLQFGTLGLESFHFDQVTISGSGHLVFWDETFIMAPVSVTTLHGDRTGLLHVIGQQNGWQHVSLSSSTSPFPVGFRVYERGRFSLPEGW